MSQYFHRDANGQTIRGYAIDQRNNMTAAAREFLQRHGIMVKC